MCVGWGGVGGGEREAQHRPALTFFLRRLRFPDQQVGEGGGRERDTSRRNGAGRTSRAPQPGVFGGREGRPCKPRPTGALFPLQAPPPGGKWKGAWPAAPSSQHAPRWTGTLREGASAYQARPALPPSLKRGASLSACLPQAGN